MRTTPVLFVALLVIVSLLLLGCEPPIGPDGATTKLSNVFFSVPTSFTGPTTPKAIGPRTVASDARVKSSVEKFYATVRDQVRFGADVAQGLKSLLLDLEQVKLPDGTFLLDSQTNLTHTASDGKKFRWTTESAGTFFLQIWTAAGGKSLELRFTKAGSRFYGAAVADPANLGWADPTPPKMKPDWVKAEFDTDSDGLGTAQIIISVQGFIYHEDLAPNLQNGIINLTKDSAGVVRLGSIIRGENSRHFVWNGYTLNTSNVEALNTGAPAQTRYYVAAGAANSANKATAYLGIPTAVGAGVFTNDGIGALVIQLFADRLNNNYDFDGTQDTAGDQGYEIIATLNSVNSTNPSLQLDTITYSNNTPQEVRDALAGAQAYLVAQSQPANDSVDYFLDMMSVANPAYFLESTYQDYGAVVPTGWPTLADADAQALLPTQTSVDNMSIAFENTANPGF